MKGFRIDRELFMECLSGPERSTPSGTTVIIAPKRQDGTVEIEDQCVRPKAYVSEFWATQPDGEYELYITQGGIRNREIPREEKVNFRRYFRHHNGGFEGALEDVSGVVKILVFKGAVTQIRIESH